MRSGIAAFGRTCLLPAVFCLALCSPAHAEPIITFEPYKEDGDGITSPLSTNSRKPTGFLWGELEKIKWGAQSNIPDYGFPESYWYVRDSEGAVTEYPAEWGWTRYQASPENILDRGDYEFWITATDDDGTVTSDTYYITMTFPPVVETKYHNAGNEFVAKLARHERTAFNFGAYENGIIDTPEVKGCDNPSMFWGNGKLHYIFGDPNVNTGDPESPSLGLSGALAFTDRVVPEKGIDIAHHRSWVMDGDTGHAKSIIAKRAGISRVNNTGGAILPYGDGYRIWFAYYDYGSGPRESYRNYYRVGIAYSDDYFSTTAVRDDNLILWDKDDTENGTYNPDPYLGYHMRLFKDHLYLMIPREGGSHPVLIRCHVDDLDNLSLDDWHWLVSVDGAGDATWSVEGVTRSQISHDDFPTVDFGDGEVAGLVNTVVWSPYHNRWVAFRATGMRVWEAKHLWGPYESLLTPRYFKVAQFAQAYAYFGHELMLGNNGEWIYHARARGWQPLGLYGTYHQRLHLRDKLRMTISPKSGISGDTITITCVNDSGEPDPPPENITVTVDGNPAIFQGQAGDTYTFTYTLTGSENAGAVGVVDVNGEMLIAMDDETDWSFPRDALLVVNHRNELSAAVTSPAAGAIVSGWVPIEVDAAYDIAPEVLAPQDPDVRILKTELRDAGSDEVMTTDVEAPYTLWINTARYENGPRSFRVIAYDTLDRRGEAVISLDVQNPSPVSVEGNRVTDGDMEASDTAAWSPIYGATLSKLSDERRRNGERSLVLHSDNPAAWAGFRQTVNGLRGGERLRFTAYGRLENNYTAQLRWNLDDQYGGTLAAKYVNSYGYFRRMMFEFDNPPGNTEVLVECITRDTGSEGKIAGTEVTTVDAIIDDIVLHPACYPIVSPPANVQVMIAPTGDAATVSWNGSTDAGIEYYAIHRKPLSLGDDFWEEITELRVHHTTFTDDDLPGPAADYEYRVVAIDDMGYDSVNSATLPLGETMLDVVDRSSSALVVDAVSGAIAYNIYSDAIGSWNSPAGGTGSVCGITTWTDNGDGTVTLDYIVPENSWVVVTASDACGEGPAGQGSDGVERSGHGSWGSCGGLP